VAPRRLRPASLLTNTFARSAPRLIGYIFSFLSAPVILGASGITLDCPVMRHASNLESVLTYESTSEVHQLIIGQALTGHSAFR